MGMSKKIWMAQSELDHVNELINMDADDYWDASKSVNLFPLNTSWACPEVVDWYGSCLNGFLSFVF